MNILAIGDDPEVFYHIATIILEEHYQVATTTRGAEAIAVNLTRNKLNLKYIWREQAFWGLHSKKLAAS